MRFTFLTIVALSVFLSVIIKVNAEPIQVLSSLPGFINNGIEGCISAPSNADGAPAVIHNCNTESLDSHSLTMNANVVVGQSTLPQNIIAFGNKCLDVTGGVNQNGVKLQWWTCGTNNPNQQWVYTLNGSSGSIRWNNTNKCVDITGGVSTDGNQLQIWECSAGNENQAWGPSDIITSFGPVQIEGPDSLSMPEGPPGNPFCIVAESSTNGAGVSHVTCSAFLGSFINGSITFTAPVDSLAGPITTFGGTKCLDVKDGNNTNGNKLQIWDCIDGNPNQLFIFSQLRIAWAGKNKCLDLTDGNFNEGTPIQIWDCIDGNSNQNWGTVGVPV